MSKINVLVISLDNDGVGYFRINSPYLAINDPDINIKFLSPSDFYFRFDENTLKNFQIIIYHKDLPFKSQEEAINFPIIKNKYNIKLIFDIDDHWILNSTHINYKNWKNSNSMEKTLNHIKNADYILTTTPLFADDIKEYNKNVLVAENAININEYQWIPKKIESDKVRFIWGGGITHKPDLMLLQDSFKRINNEMVLKSQVYMCGFDLRIRTKQGIFKDNPNRNTWTQFESIFTNNGRLINNNEYRTWINTHDDNGRLNYGYNEKFKDEFYQRRWTKPIFTYGTMYNEVDVALAPLKSGSKFNLAKSQLKILEAGIHKCPIIASNYGPYTLDITDGVHGFLIEENDKMGWFNKMKYFIENPNAVKEMGLALNDLILEKYTLDKINKKRIDLIKSFI